jgi:hypothetical protein
MNTFGDDWHIGSAASPRCGFQGMACFLKHSLYQSSVHLSFVFETVDPKFVMINGVCMLLVD